MGIQQDSKWLAMGACFPVAKLGLWGGLWSGN